MAWSDSIFSSNPPPNGKLGVLAKICRRVYEGTVQYSPDIDPDSATRILTTPFVNVWTYTIEGEKHVCIEGTTQRSQVSFQTAGYFSPQTWPGGGLVNGYILEQAGNVAAVCPPDTKVFVGHSLGGALAVAVAYGFKVLNRPIAGAITFGTARDWTASALPTFSGMNIKNIVATHDVVQNLPPPLTGGHNWYTPGQYWELTSDGTMLSYVQGITNPVTLAYDAAIYGDSQHWTQHYIAALAGVANNHGSSSMASNIFRVKVQGSLGGQRIMNVLHYYIAGGVGGAAATLLAQFREKWQQKILPSVSARYQVLKYSLDQIDGVVPKNLVEDPVTPVYRYTNAAETVGTNADNGIIASGTDFPSFVAIGANKVCSAWLLDDNSSTTLQKKPKGGIRIAGVIEAQNEDNEGNKLNDTMVSLWQTNLTALRHWNIASFEWTMCVIRNRIGLSPITIEPSTQLRFHYALVNSLALNPYLTSQISRKQNLSRLG